MARLARRADVVLTLVALALCLLLHGDFGATWDEHPHALTGEGARRFFFEGLGLAGLREVVVPLSEFYAPGLDLLVATLARAAGTTEVATRHLVQGLVWVALVWPVVGLGRRAAGRRGAWLAGVALLGLPTLLGHSCNNPKDLPLATACAWLLHAAAWLGAARRLGWRHALGLGLALGCVLATRPAAWFLVAAPGLALAARAWTARRRGRRAVEAEVVRGASVLLGALPLAWALMVALWPQALASPLVHPVRSALFATRFDLAIPTLFAGELVPSDALPRRYLPTLLLLAVPLPTWALAAWGHAALAGRARRSPRRLGTLLALLFGAWFAVAYCVAARPNVYDGMRHFLFVLPPLAVLAGAGGAACARALRPWLGRGALPAAGLLLLSGAPAMVTLHPYEAAYFNALGGERATLHERYDLDYWVSSYREAALWVSARQREAPRPLTVVVAANDFSLPTFSGFVDPRVRVVALPRWAKATALPADVDYWVATVRWDQWRRFPERPVVHRVERGGALFCVIRGPAPR